MKKHLISIQSTRPAEQHSLFSYNSINTNNINTHTTTHTATTIHKQLTHIFKTLKQLSHIRSYLLHRDIQQIYNLSSQFFQHYLNIYNPQQLFAFAFPNTNLSAKLYQREQIQMFVNIIFQLNKIKHNKAAQCNNSNNKNMKQFQHLKLLIQHIQQQCIQYQVYLREIKQQKLLQMKSNQYKQKQQQLNNYQHQIKQKLQQRHQRIKSTQLQTLNSLVQSSQQKHNSININNNNINNNTNININSQYHQSQQSQHSLQKQQQQKQQTKLSYTTKPSKLLSQAKQLSLLTKLSPYMSQQKRQYHHTTLNNQLSKTINLDMQRRVKLIDKMKSIEKQKIYKHHQKRYSFIEDKLKQQKYATDKSLNNKRQQLQQTQLNQLSHIKNRSKTYKNNIVTHLKNSFNAYNMHSDTKQINKIIKNHRLSIQFQTDVSKLNFSHNSSSSRGYLQKPKYTTITYNMNQQNRQQQRQQQSIQRQQKRILRRFSKPKQSLLYQLNSNNNSSGNSKHKSLFKQQSQEYDMINDSLIKQKHKIKREKSLVALYDDQLEKLTN